jgi:hypothetical protein
MASAGLIFMRRVMDAAQRTFVATSILGSLWVCFNVGMFTYESAQKRKSIAATTETEEQKAK